MRFKFPKYFRFWGLAFRYSLFFLVAILIIFFIAFVYSYGYSVRLLVEGAQKDADILTQQTIVRFENTLLPVELVPQTLVHALENPNVSYNDVIRIAKDFVIRNDVVFGSALAFEPYAFDKDTYWYAAYTFERSTGVIQKMLGGRNYDYFTKDWFRLPKLLNKPVWTEPYFDKGGGDTLMCTYSVPIYKSVNGSRKFIGVLTMDISLATFQEIVNGIKVYKSGYGFLISHNGRILTFPKPGFVNKNILDVARKGKGTETILAIKNMMNGKTGFSSMDGLEAKHSSSFISYAPVSSTGWSFGIMFPSRELLSDLLQFLKDLLWIFSFSLVALLITTVLITRRLTRPISRLVEATRKIGQGDFHAKLPIRKSRDEIAQLTKAFSVMQDELSSYILNLQETTIAKEKIESELNVAHTIQMGMLPRGFNTPENWDLFATIDPAKAVGGDLYDFFYLDPDHLCIAIGDVAGKGVPASLFMMVTRTLLRAKLIANRPIEEVMQSINKELCLENPNQMFVTFFAGIVDLKTGEMDFCNAGHNYPYIISADGKVRQLKVRNGLPLGIFDTEKYTSGRFSFHSREILVLSTDGITDALNKSNDFFGEAQLTESLAMLANKSSKELTETLIYQLKRFSTGTEQADDITILALQYKDPRASKSDSMQNVQLNLANQLTELDKLVVQLESLAESWKIPGKTIMELNLVIEELFTNIVFYAFEEKSDHRIIVNFALMDSHRLRIQIIDDGKPFNLLEAKVSDQFGKPLEERKIGGLGIHFVREMMDGVEYQRTNDQNIVTLTKNF
ncbi:MAG: SpoIIE family protein phosphatase [Bacteroidales bacterium]|nr:SpoIIE family protein phosphatase [Bacteroidales bacterium]